MNAFVVRFDPETDAAAGRIHGRIEHVASFKAAHFGSVEELLAFVAGVLPASSDEDDRPGGEDAPALNANS